jgi:hypothetical protein
VVSNSRAFIEGSGAPIYWQWVKISNPLFVCKQAMQARRWRMLLDSKKANEMQAAVDTVFARLPKIFKTKETRIEIAKSVVRSEREYHEAARRCVLGMFASVDRAIENREKLANLK